MVDIRVVNWRCINELELELERFNVFIGRNSTGKSSLAYSVYFASKSRDFDPQYLLTQTYGHDFDVVARLVDNKPQFPISIRIVDSEFSVKPGPLLKLPELPREARGQDEKKESETKEFEITKLESSPWEDAVLLPSRRAGYIQIMMLLPKIIRELRAKPETEAITRMLGGFVGGFFELIRTLPLFPPFGMFMSDYTRAMTGLRLESITGELHDVGSYIVNVLPLFSLIELFAQDPYTKLQLPAELAPDGLLDFGIFDSMVQRVARKSLVVIEEPEIHKNPLMIMQFTENMVEKVLDRKHTLLMTTHSDIPLTTIAKLVAKGKLKAEDVRIYYLKRDPWTRVSEIRVFEDGTLESLPDAEELITRLF